MTNETEEKTEETPTKKEEKKTQKKAKNKKVVVNLVPISSPEHAPRNMDPARFTGDGMTFKGKLIGTDDVTEPRGDQMCQRTMQKLKAGVKSQGPHKQRILLRISMAGLKIVDEKSGNVEHEHAVHRISFISRDITDTRAFGYVYGNSDGTHKFFAIKTEKASETIVLSLRDLFSVVYELKKKEMEAAKAKQSEEHTYENLGMKGASGDQGSAEHIYEVPKSNQPVVEEGEVKVACLLDLETELESIQQGIMQMDAFSDPFVLLDSTAESAPADPSDPFGSTAWKPRTPDPFVVNVAAANALVSIKPPPSNAPTLAPPSNTPTALPPTSTSSMSPPSDLNSSDNPFNNDPFFVSSTPAPKARAADKYSALQDLSAINSTNNNTFLETSTTTPGTFLDSNTTMNQAFAASIFDPPLTPVNDTVLNESESVTHDETEDDNDPFRELCPLGKKKEAKKPKELFADMQPVPPKKTLKQMIEETNPIKFETSEDPFAVAPSPVRKPHPPNHHATFQADFTPDPTNPFQGSTDASSPPPKPPRVEEAPRPGAISPPSPGIPPPPLPTDVSLQQPPAPPPRPRPHATKAAPSGLIQPPVLSPPRSQPGAAVQTIKLDVSDPFASDPFFTQPFGEENNNKKTGGAGAAGPGGAGDPFAVFDKVDISPFKLEAQGQSDEGAVYATVSKPKRAI